MGVTIRGEDGRPREIGRVESVHIGIEDHGIFSFNLGFDFGGTHQGIGHLVLGVPSADDFSPNGTRLLYAVARVLGNLAHAKGREVMVIRADDDWGAQIVGIQALIGGEPLIFADVLGT